MSILVLFAILIFIALGAWIVQQSGWPTPLTWGAYGILFIVVLICLLKVSGVSLGTI